MEHSQFKSGKDLSPKSILIWRIVQAAVFLVGLIIFLALIFYPNVGLILLWNILIPVAPLLLVVSVGLWRNICPLATTNLLPRHFNLSKKKKMTVKQQSILGLVSVIALYLIVPLRHALLNNNGMAAAIMFVIAIVVGVSMGFIYDWKSGWCSSLCPIHPVEKLYGGNTLISLPNAHCDACVKCSVPCPDSTPNVHPKIVQKNIYQKISSLLLIGGFPGFVWGWFQVPDANGFDSFGQLMQNYYIPLGGMVLSLVVYLVLSAIVGKSNERTLTNVFAASAVSCYYWYRIPNLFGFGQFEKDGLLVDLKNMIPAWSITAIIVALAIFFFYWLVFRNLNKKSWVVRPSYS
ncbi:MAG: hypothetical protein LCH67_16550 [Bacteroidetes bacterium]|nr:hypothetical protein [Bacteroidota bacterium]